MSHRITFAALLGAGAIVLGGLSGCAAADNEPQTKRATTEQPSAPANDAATPPVENAAPAEPEPAEPSAPEGPKETVSEANARAQAQSYLDMSGFSRKGLIDQLKFEGYSEKDATYGADAVGADWNEQAARKAKDYLDMSAFSRSGLIEQLKFEGFTQEQATYGVSTTGL